MRSPVQSRVPLHYLKQYQDDRYCFFIFCFLGIFLSFFFLNAVFAFLLDFGKTSFRFYCCIIILLFMQELLFYVIFMLFLCLLFKKKWCSYLHLKGVRSAWNDAEMGKSCLLDGELPSCNVPKFCLLLWIAVLYWMWFYG